MSFTDSLFRNSFWSYETHDIVLRRLSEIHTPTDEAPTASQPQRQSRFSISSEDDRAASSISSNAVASPLPQPLQWTPQLDKALPPIPRAYRLTKKQRKHVSVRNSGLNAINEISWPMPPGMKPPLPPSADPVYITDKMSRCRVCLFVLTIGMAQLCTQAGIGQTLAISREIGASFGKANTRNLIWALTGYSLAIGTFIMIAGRLGDVYGHKRIFLAGFAWSAVWSAISGTAVYSNHALFIASRVFHGTGAALSLPNGLALLGVTYPPGKAKAMAFTFVATMGPVGIIVGSASASLLALAWWPLTYWIFAGILLVIAGVGYFTIPKLAQKSEMPRNISAAITDLDIPGAIIGISALVLISFAWNQAPLVGWQEPYLWVALIIGTLLAVLFVLVENYYAPKPLVPFYALSSDISFMLIAGACGWSCFGIWAFYTWQFVGNIRGISPLLTAAYVSPCIVVGSLTTLSIGFVLERLRTRIVVFISLLGFTLGSALVATMPAVQSYWSQLFVSVLIVSWAMDTGFPVTALALLNVTERRHQGIGASLVSIVMSYGMSIGLGVARTVESYVNDSGKSIENKLSGYRAALYVSLGLAGFGALLYFAFLLNMLWQKRGDFYSRHTAAVEGNQI